MRRNSRVGRSNREEKEKYERSKSSERVKESKREEAGTSNYCNMTASHRESNE